MEYGGRPSGSASRIFRHPPPMSFPPPTPAQARLIWLALCALAVAIILALAAGAVWGLGKVLRLLSPVLWPLAIAGVLAYLLDPVVDFIESCNVPRTRAIVGVFACAVTLMLGLTGSIVPQLVGETRDLVNRIPVYTERLQDRVEEWV